MSSNAPPPPPPGPPPPTFNPVRGPAPPTPPDMPAQGPLGAFRVDLCIFNGHPFKDHWAYRVHSNIYPGRGVLIHATGDVRTGFVLQYKRGHNPALTRTVIDRIIPLQWVDGHYIDEAKMFNNGGYKLDGKPVCLFEDCAAKVPAPTKSLNDSTDNSTAGKKIVQRNCQTWIVESAHQLAQDGIFTLEVAAYLAAAKQ